MSTVNSLQSTIRIYFYFSLMICLSQNSRNYALRNQIAPKVESHISSNHKKITYIKTKVQ